VQSWAKRDGITNLRSEECDSEDNERVMRQVQELSCLNHGDADMEAARSKAWVCGRSLAGIVGGYLFVVGVVCFQVEVSASG
jgi:hypothetical protein